MTGDSELQRVRVWDLPTRVFHWVLALTVVAAVVTAKIGGNAMEWHLRCGLLVMALLMFRLVWGLVGGYWSRFAAFVYSPRTVRAYWRGDAGPGGRYAVGHSPTGAWSVFAMLMLLIVQVATGLVADDEIATTGPLNRFVSSALAGRASAWHASGGQWLVYLLVAAHIGAVLYYLRRKKTDLIQPMLRGDKMLPAGTPASRDGAGTRLLAVAIALATVLAAWSVGRLGN